MTVTVSEISITTSMSCSTSTIGNPARVPNIEDEAGEIALFINAHSGHRLVHDQNLRTQSERTTEVDALAHAVAQVADLVVTQIFKFEEFDDLLGLGLEELLLGARTRPIDERVEKTGAHVRVKPRKDILPYGH